MKTIANFKDSPFSLKQIALFCDLPEENQTQIRAALAHCMIVEFKAGEIVLDSHSKQSHLYVILSGTLAQTAQTSRRQLEQAHVQYFPGECVGELAVLDDQAHSASIAAVVVSQLLVIDSDSLWQLIDQSNGVARNLLQLLSFRLRAANAQLRNRQKIGEFYRQLSMVDGLTALHNRSWLNAQLPGLIDNAHATETELSVIMADLDHFKEFNDRFGHVKGDEALQTAARIISTGLRPNDFAARYGGEEMLVILPNTSKESALVVAERLCDRIRQATIFDADNNALPPITVSLGLASLAQGQDGLALIANADAALYRAKERGRNQVAV